MRKFVVTFLSIVVLMSSPIFADEPQMRPLIQNCYDCVQYTYGDECQGYALEEYDPYDAPQNYPSYGPERGWTQCTTKNAGIAGNAWTYCELGGSSCYYCPPGGNGSWWCGGGAPVIIDPESISAPPSTAEGDEFRMARIGEFFLTRELMTMDQYMAFVTDVLREHGDGVDDESTKARLLAYHAKFEQLVGRKLSSLMVWPKANRRLPVKQPVEQTTVNE